MSGRIRSIKPEWLEDERMALASSEARVLSVGLLLLADDYGRGRAPELLIAARVFPGKPINVTTSAMNELVEMGYVVLYQNNGQSYFAIKNWAKHQRVDKPGKPLVPSPDSQIQASGEESPDAYTYIARRGDDGPIKIGFSIDPDARAEALSKTQAEKVRILATIPGRKHEKLLHRKFSHLRIESTEWFEPHDDILDYATSIGMAGGQRTGNGRATDGQRTGVARSRLTNDHDHDQRPRKGPTTTTGPQPCPADLRLTEDQVATLQTTPDVPDWAIKTLTSEFVANAQADPSDIRTIVAWRKCLAKMISARWLDPARRPKKPGPSDAERREANKRMRELQAREARETQAKLAAEVTAEQVDAFKDGIEETWK